MEMTTQTATGRRFYAHYRRYFEFVTGRRPGGGDAYAQYLFNAHLREWTRGEADDQRRLGERVSA